MKPTLSHWQGRPILDPEHSHDLEVRAAVNEFSKGMPRHEAEDAAYKDYVKDQRLTAAAHHLAGAKAAQAAGSMDEGRKHGMLYELHLKALGLDPHGPVPSEVSAKLGSVSDGKLYRFKAHGGDHFALQDHKEDEERVAKSERLAKGDVVDLNPKLQQRAAAETEQKTQHLQGVLDSAAGIMTSDPGFQQASRKRAAERQMAEHAAGPQKYMRGHRVVYSNANGEGAIPADWKGVVTGHEWIDHDERDPQGNLVSQPHHYYNVKWTTPKGTTHEGHYHQDDLAPPPLRKAEPDPELAKDTCDYTAKSTGERCKNPRSRKVADRFLCHHHADLAAKDDHRADKAKK